MSENNPNFDVIVIGGGPAGLSAALWCEELGLETLLLEKEHKLGGQLNRVYNPIENHLGIETLNGEEMCRRFVEQIDKRKVSRRLRANVTAITARGNLVSLENGERVAGKAIIIATGVRRRRIAADGYDTFWGKGIIESGKKDSTLAEGKKALIVGGGDAAIENALILSEVAERVFVAHRRKEFTAREEFLDKAKRTPNIEFLTGRTLRKISGVEKVQAVELENTTTGETEVLPVEIVLVRIGVEPNTAIFRGILGMDVQGYIAVNEKCGTTVEGVYAVGDAANPLAPTVSSAVGMGATAARAVYDYLLQTRDLNR